MAAATVISGGSEAVVCGGRKVATVWLFCGGGWDGGEAGGGVEFATLAGVVDFLLVAETFPVLFVAFFGVCATAFGCTTACGGASGLSGISSGKASAMVGACVCGGKVGFFLLHASVDNKANRRSKMTNLRCTFILEFRSDFRLTPNGQ
jgi:hypothetical protein